MSREEAHRRTGARRRRAPDRTASAPPEDVARPQPPLFTARTDEADGSIRTRGHVDRVSADVLCRVVTALQQLGHRHVQIRLGTATVDDDAHRLLVEHARRLRGDGVRVLLR